MTHYFKHIVSQSRLGTYRFLVMLVSVGSLALSACTPRGHGNDDTATFSLTREITGSSEIARQVPGFSIPTVRLYNFKACLQNRRTQEPLRLAPFDIIGAAKEIKTRTDDGGCLNWSEEIPYNHLADERFLTLERDIRATGMEAGTRRVRIAINPWGISKGSTVLDIDRAKSVPDQTLSSKDSVAYVKAPAKDGRSLVVSGLTIENTPVQSADSIVRKFRITFHPTVLVNDMFGEPKPYPLARAKMTASVRMIAINAIAGEDRAVEVGGANDIPVVPDGDFYRFEYSPRIKNANRNSRFQLAIQLNPVDGPSDLLPYKSLYSIGDLQILTAAPTIPAVLRDRDYTQSPDVPKDLPVQTTDPQVNQNLVNVASGVRKSKPFEIGEIKVEFMGTPAENGLVRRVVFRNTTCITDVSNGGRPALDEDFKAIVGEGRNRRTIQMVERYGPGLEGCYSWDDSITHRFYEPVVFYHVPFEIKHFQSGFSEHRMLGVNPWDRFLIGLDYKIAKGTIDTFNARKAPPSRLTTDSFNFETVAERKYSVDEFMNLKMLKTIQVRVPMRVERFSDMIAGRSLGPETLRKNVWGFRAMIYMRGKHFTGEEFEEFIPMEGGHQLTTTQSGDIKARIDVNIADARLFRMRSMMLFEVVPIDESKLNPQELATMTLDPDHKYEDVIERESKLVTPTFSAPLWFGREKDNNVPFPLDILIAGGRTAADDARHLQGLSYDQILERAKKSEAQMIRQANISKSLVGYLKNANLDFVTLHNEDAVYASNEGLAKQNMGFPSRNGAGTLLNYLNFKFPEGVLKTDYFGFQNSKPVHLNDLQAFIEERRDLDRPLAGHFCMALVHQINGPAFTKPKDALKECLKALRTDFLAGGRKGLNVFAIDHALRIFETDGGKQIPTAAPAIGFTVGADAVVLRSETAGAQVGAELSAGATVGAGRLFKGSPMAEFMSARGGLSIGGNYNWSRSVSESGVITSSQPLAMENIEIEATAKRYEACTSIRFRSEFWKRRGYLFKHNTNLTGDALMKRLTRGLYICTGYENKTPIKIREKFFTFVQPQHEGFRLDQGDISAYPFLVSIRGANDLTRFMGILNAKKSSALPAIQVSDDFHLVGYPLNRLNDAIKAYDSKLPSQPGTFVFEESVKVVPINYPQQNLPWWGRLRPGPFYN